MQLEFQCQKCEESFPMDVSDVQSDPVLRCPGCGTAPDEQVEAVVAGLEELFAHSPPLRRKFSTSVEVNSEDMPPATTRSRRSSGRPRFSTRDSEDDDAEEEEEEVAELE